jgi:ankyrin repeat protein
MAAASRAPIPHRYRKPPYLTGWESGKTAVSILLAAGASASAVDKEGRTPLHAAATDNCGAATVKVLLAAKASPSAVDKEGCTPLHAAAANLSAEAVWLLLAAGASTTVADNGG